MNSDSGTDKAAGISGMVFRVFACGGFWDLPLNFVPLWA